MKIKRLDQTTINKIGAGEVIQRPFNVVKELIENSIDAHCSSVIISIGKGGLESIVVTDDGCGISLEDLKVLGGRYTTSKSIEGDTYGYRGEALSCMTYVSKVTIISRTATSEIGYKVVFQNGQIIENPIPLACSVGTTVIVDNLFDKMLRKKSMKETEEYKKIISIIRDYAIHKATIAFTLRKAGTSVCEIKTEKNSTVLKNITKIFTTNISNNLQQYSYQCLEPPFQMICYLSNSTFQGKKNKMIFFVNDRYVEHIGLKKVIERIYDEYLPKVNYFVYLSINVNKERIDCNVNPSKTAVRLLEEEKLINQIDKFLNSIIIEFSQTRSFPPSQIKTQPIPNIQQEKFFNRVDSTSTSLLSYINDDRKKVLQNTRSQYSTGKPNCHNEEIKIENDEEIKSPFKIQRKKEENNETSTKLPKQPESLKHNNSLKKVINKEKENNKVHIEVIKRRPNKFKEDLLPSLKKLRDQFEKENVNIDMIPILNESTLIGMIDTSYGLIQSSTTMFLIHIPTIIQDLVYQQIIYSFSSFNIVEIEPKLTINQLLEVTELNYEKQQSIKSQLIQHRSLLFQYFSITITENGEITTLPDVLPGYLPTASALPFFISLFSEIKWDDEISCLKEIAINIGKYYSLLPTDISIIDLNKMVEHLLLPYIKTTLIPQQSYENVVITHIADIAKLYHVFERC
ncbi:DNA mismatch repair protein mlh1, putative [Entamoeba dispar SAW760]|uniref:DNA mismatch repair protein mlh1, putative n=1 Tax=Entamoeba dispar (strain ATCC PRA-260 / SAW760) TaxID=370354 RepID=B0EJ70_ENTDS|nr:DNA mismatch repair protein mlh1, putative [Entamoeba dispar SAW760]EDR25378.1 DNA mismatch repair protein mlh1, putative [Entamoeba dispar SAW760]|eukprot:EDR25378.1 DNA mismatch repair protein mlh1, putative [Entamoeba dispar SAW760]